MTLRYHTPAAEITATLNVSFEVTEGERLVLLGPSGCGKSTLLKSIGGFIAPTAGQILLDGRRVAGPGPDRVMVFQEFDQFMPWKTMLDNVAFPLRASRKAKSRAEAEERVTKVGLKQFAQSYPHELGGGASPSPARSQWSRAFCSWTSPSRRWTR